MRKKDYKPPDILGKIVPGGADNIPRVDPGTAGRGQPTLYKPEYCRMIVEHMAQGFSPSSFGAVVDVSAETISEWRTVHKDFSDAVNKGYVKAERYYMQMGAMLATGQLRRVVKEEPVVDAQGRAQFDSRGEVLKRYEYAPAQGNVAAWIFLTKNVLRTLGWRDRWELSVTAAPPTEPGAADDEPREVIEARVLRLVEKAKVGK